MQKTILVLAGLCFIAGCGKNSDRVDWDVRITGDTNKPLYIKSAAEQLPVEIKTQTDRALPVEIKAQTDAVLPVEIKAQTDTTLPVEIKVQTDTVLPVEMKVNKEMIIIAVIAAVMMICTFLTAVFSWLAARNVRKAIEQKSVKDGMRC
jgi:hypothetical protein